MNVSKRVKFGCGHYGEISVYLDAQGFNPATSDCPACEAVKSRAEAAEKMTAINDGGVRAKIEAVIIGRGHKVPAKLYIDDNLAAGMWAAKYSHGGKKYLAFVAK